MAQGPIVLGSAHKQVFVSVGPCLQLFLAPQPSSAVRTVPWVRAAGLGTRSESWGPVSSWGIGKADACAGELGSLESNAAPEA